MRRRLKLLLRFEQIFKQLQNYALKFALYAHKQIKF